MDLNDSLRLNIPYFHAILFTYHDSIFCAEKNDSGIYSYSYLNMKREAFDQFYNMHKSYDGVRLSVQSKKTSGKGSYRGCGPIGYCMTMTNTSSHFSHFSYGDFLNWSERSHNIPVELTKEQFPKIYQWIEPAIEGEMLNYYFSDMYQYKNIRIQKMYKLRFPRPESIQQYQL